MKLERQVVPPSFPLLTRSAARLTASGKKPALVQKPDGQAGRNFNLATALEDGVGMDKKTYRKYYVRCSDSLCVAC